MKLYKFNDKYYNVDTIFTIEENLRIINEYDIRNYYCGRQNYDLMLSNRKAYYDNINDLILPGGPVPEYEKTYLITFINGDKIRVTENEFKKFRNSK